MVRHMVNGDIASHTGREPVSLEDSVYFIKFKYSPKGELLGFEASFEEPALQSALAISEVPTVDEPKRVENEFRDVLSLFVSAMEGYREFIAFTLSIMPILGATMA